MLLRPKIYAPLRSDTLSCYELAVSSFIVALRPSTFLNYPFLLTEYLESIDSRIKWDNSSQTQLQQWRRVRRKPLRPSLYRASKLDSILRTLCTRRWASINLPLNSILTSLKLDIEGLNITVTSGGKSGVKPKGKQRAEGLETLGNASLKLKAGVHYALIGRNGTGKSSQCVPMLRSIFN